MPENPPRRFTTAPLIGAESKRNPLPAPLLADAKDKGIASCEHCKKAGARFEVVWDQAGFAKMERHLIEHHPEVI